MGFWSEIIFFNLIFNSNGQYINTEYSGTESELRSSLGTWRVSQNLMVYVAKNYVRSSQEHLQMQWFAREVTGNQYNYTHVYNRLLKKGQKASKVRIQS